MGMDFHLISDMHGSVKVNRDKEATQVIINNILTLYNFLIDL